MHTPWEYESTETYWGLYYYSSKRSLLANYVSHLRICYLTMSEVSTQLQSLPLHLHKLCSEIMAILLSPVFADDATDGKSRKKSARLISNQVVSRAGISDR